MKQCYHKITTIILILLLLFVYTTSFVLATEDVDTPSEQGVFFVISQETMKQGEQVTVSIVNQSGIAVTGGQFRITYDTERFDLLSKTVLGQEPITFNQPEGEIGSFEAFQYVDAANPYAENIIASFTFQNKGTLSGSASFILAKSVISYGPKNEAPKTLKVQNDTVTLEVVNEDPEEIPSNGGEVIPEPTDPDEPIIPTGTSYLEPEPTEPKTEPTDMTTTEPTATKPTEASTTKPTNTTTKATTARTEPSNTTTEKPTDTMKTIDIQESGSSQISERPSQNMTEPTGTKQTDANREDPIIGPTKSEGSVIPDDRGQETLSAKNETTIETIVITLGTKDPVNIAESEPQKTMQILKLETEQNDKDRTDPVAQTKMTETKNADREVATTSEIEATAQNSEMTKSMEQNQTEEKQAKQERAFKLTGKDEELNNKVIIGSLTLITLSSAIALGFMIFQNHIKPR